MAKLDQGYSQTRRASGGRRGRRGNTIDSFVSQSLKHEVADLYIRPATKGSPKRPIQRAHRATCGSEDQCNHQ